MAFSLCVGDYVQGRTNELIGMYGIIVDHIGEGRQLRNRVNWNDGSCSDHLDRHLWKVQQKDTVFVDASAVGIEEESDIDEVVQDDDQSVDTVATSDENIDTNQLTTENLNIDVALPIAEKR